MNKVLYIEENRSKAIISFLKPLLEEKKISAVFSLRNIENVRDYGLITDPEKLDYLDPFYPLMPLNAGQIIGRFTPMKKPIAAILKPCEFRAFIELVKREQGSLDNFLLITYTCGGVFPLMSNISDDIDKNLENYNKANLELKNNELIRETCKSCTNFAPENSDVLISLLGEDDKGTTFYLNTEKGEQFSGHLEKSIKDGDFNKTKLDSLLAERKKEEEKQFALINTEETGLDGLINIFGKCIGCKGCNTVCPICYCTLCDFSSNNYEYNTEILEKELLQKGAIRLPPDTLFFHIGRLSHMSFSCVGCGQCTDVCPTGIPVATIFKRTGKQTADLFKFEPGRDVKELIPVMIFKEEEFPESGE